ncbi:hypothetical protein J2789_004460 [Variovorax paradoxus]|uniref:hypothetical protein n=1 Tax=Variovorax atrisoli TaxID=3394203 RepID=UPI001198FBF2|nr:hypothetical protein [Variovorax paradoxus]MDR6521770.1 hypothetical protein [Variovorax paradoxus]
MPAPPARNDISGAGATPSNAQARDGFGKLWDYVTGLLGLTGNAAEARDALGIGPAISGRQKAINGNFSINQDGVSGTVVLAAGAYGHDGWKAGAGGCTYTFATNGIDTVATISAGTLVQVIDGAKLDGGDYVMSWNGTAQGRIGAGAYASNLVTATGLAAATNVTVEFGTGTLGLMQFEPGKVRTPFERRDELNECQRYCIYGKIQIGGAYSTGGASAQVIGEIQFPRAMRAAPTMAQLPGSASVNVSANSFLTVASSGCGVSVTQGASAGNFSLFLLYSAKARL